MNLYTEALIFAAQKHDGQTRKDGSRPYITHPIAVAEILRKAGYDERYQAVGLLHDVLEDTETSVDELKRFGDDIADAVVLLTRQPEQDEGEYVNNILQNSMAAAVKSADKVHNLFEMTYGGIKGEEKPEEMRQFARQYARKSDAYYYGKFCRAVDEAIGLAKSGAMWLSYHESRYPNYSGKEMKLYSQIEKEDEERLRKAYEQGIEKPDFENSEILYFERNGYLYCTYGKADGIRIKIAPTWYLSKAGWLPTKVDIFSPDFYDDLFELKREDFVLAVKYFIQEKGLYDFVDERLY